MYRHRAGLGVSPTSPWARATPSLGATKREKKKFILYINFFFFYTYTLGKKNCIHKPGQKNIYSEGKKKKKKLS